MIKLDNRGWGYVMFLFFLGVLVVALFMVVYMVNDFEKGISRKKEKTIYYSQYQRYRRFEREVSSSAMIYSQKHGIYNQINILNLDIEDDIKKECIGYASYDNKDSIYVAYLKCDSYQTEGYVN